MNPDTSFSTGETPMSASDKKSAAKTLKANILSNINCKKINTQSDIYVMLDATPWMTRYYRHKLFSETKIHLSEDHDTGIINEPTDDGRVT